MLILSRTLREKEGMGGRGGGGGGAEDSRKDWAELYGCTK